MAKACGQGVGCPSHVIPFATTALTIDRTTLAAGVDPYDPNPPAPVTIATGVRAVISTPSASTHLVGGMENVYNARLTCDICDLQTDDSVTETDGTQWRCLWVRPQVGLGVDHLVAQLRMITGNAA